MTLSSFDEQAIYGKKMILQKALNEEVVLEDLDGKTDKYIDLMSAYGACNFGHCNPHIQPFQDYEVDIAACFYPKEAEQFSNWLINKLGRLDYEVLFQVGGSQAVSTALSISIRARKGKIVFVDGSFHGLGLDALCATSTHQNFALQKTELIQGIQNQFIKLPVNKKLSDIGYQWDEISCFIFEPIQGANGYIPLPAEWLQETVSEAQQAGAVVISDEIQCGYYRHGYLSVANTLSLRPDIYLFSKSLTNGLYPLSCVVYDSKIKESLTDKFYLAHTFQTSSLGAFAAKAVADFIDQNDIRAMCTAVEQEMRVIAKQLKELNIVTNIFVTGPTLSFEVVGIKGKDIVQKCLKEGLLIFTGGAEGQRLRVAPPVTIDIIKLKKCLNILKQVIENELVILSN